MRLSTFMESAYDQNQRKGSWLGTIGKIGLGAGVLGLGYLGYKKFGLPKWGWGRQRNLQPKLLAPSVNKNKLIKPIDYPVQNGKSDFLNQYLSNNAKLTPSLNKNNKQFYSTKNLYS